MQDFRSVMKQLFVFFDIAQTGGFKPESPTEVVNRLWKVQKIFYVHKQYYICFV